MIFTVPLRALPSESVSGAVKLMVAVSAPSVPGITVSDLTAAGAVAFCRGVMENDLKNKRPDISAGPPEV